jgi:hypothetical protein
VHIFHRMGKEAIQFFSYTGKHLANYSQKLSNISKQSKLIPKEFRYQEKIHAISDMPREKKILQILPRIFFFNKKKCNMEMTSYARQDQT